MHINRFTLVSFPVSPVALRTLTGNICSLTALPVIATREQIPRNPFLVQGHRQHPPGLLLRQEQRCSSATVNTVSQQLTPLLCEQDQVEFYINSDSPMCCQNPADNIRETCSSATYSVPQTPFRFFKEVWNCHEEALSCVLVQKLELYKYSKCGEGLN